MKNTVFCFLLIFSTLNIFAKEINIEDKFAIHPRLGYGLNYYNSNFSHFQGTVDCGIFENGAGNGLIFDLGIEYQVFSGLFFNLNLGAIDRSGIFSLYYSTPTRNMENNIIWYETKNSLETTLNYFTISPQIIYTLNKQLFSGPLRLIGGLTIGLPYNTSFKQYEEITEPKYIVFENPDGTSSKYRQILAGNILTINNYLLGINFGIENLLYAGKDNYFSQALVFNYNFNDVASDVNWKTYSIALLLGYRFSILNKTDKIKPSKPQTPLNPILSVPIIEEKEIIVKKKQEIPKFSKKQELEIDNIEFTDLQINQGRKLLASPPIVNAIFFEKNSSNIPNNYFQSTQKNKDYYIINPVVAHNYLLVRIAKLLEQNPKSSIKLIGYSSGEKDEHKPLDLAQGRAESVRNAFVNMGVSQNRISVTHKKTPIFASNQEFEEGKEENRRVDITLINAQFQEFINYIEYSELSGIINILLQSKFLTPASVLEISTNFHSNIIDIDYGNILDNKIIIPFTKHIDNDSDNIIGEITIQSDSLKSYKKREILLKGIPSFTNNINLSYFKAILRFDYNNSSLTKNNKELILQLLSIIPDNSTINISSSTDALGTDERNEKLVILRANNTKQFIQRNNRKNIIIKIKNEDYKFNESTPQGRFLNRSITITIE